MTIDEMQKHVDAVHAARQRYQEAKRNLALLNASYKGRANNMSWRPTLTLKKGDGYYGSRDITVTIDLPFGVVQQQLVYAVDAARRALIKLGDLPED